MKSRRPRWLEELAAQLLSRTPLRYWPVRIRHGYLRGCRWTLWPHSAYWLGSYEPDVQSALARLRPGTGKAAWDLGAHFGFYTLWLARAVGPSGQVCAFEPDHVSSDRLRRHVEMNGLGQVRVYPCAASDSAGERQLVQSEGAGATTSHLPYLGEVAGRGGTVAVRTVALDALLESDRLAPPQLMKIDIEGHAAAALRGAQGVLRRHRPVLLVSLHSPDELDGVRAQTEPLGYRPFALGGSPIEWPAALFNTVVLEP
jgi:FkbM family methyltransferase